MISEQKKRGAGVIKAQHPNTLLQAPSWAQIEKADRRGPTCTHPPWPCMAHIQLDDRKANSKFAAHERFRPHICNCSLQGNVNWYYQLQINSSERSCQQNDCSSSTSCCRHASNKELCIPNTPTVSRSVNN
jgi:hypothetical protein